MSGDEDIIELIYGAALDPTLWTAVMERVADRIGGEGASLSRLNMTDGSGDALLARSDPATLQAYAEHFERRNVLTVVEDPVNYRAGRTSGVATDEAALPREAFESSEFYNDFLRPQDIDSALWVRLDLSEREVTTITVGRSARRGRFEAGHLEAALALRPHLVRAYKLGRNLAGRLGLENDLLQAVETSPHAVVILDLSGAVIHANGRARELLGAGRGLGLVGGRLFAAHAEVNPALQKLIAAGIRSDGIRSGGAMGIPSPNGRMPLALRTSPIPGTGMPIFGAPGGLLVTVTDLDRQLRSPADELRLLFGLTAAEARLADAIFDGLSLPEAADRFGLSLHTVRFQIARVFEKAGVARQTDLVKLMMRLAG